MILDNTKAIRRQIDAEIENVDQLVLLGLDDAFAAFSDSFANLADQLDEIADGAVTVHQTIDHQRELARARGRTAFEYGVWS